MNPIVFALRHPVTVLTGLAALALGAAIALGAGRVVGLTTNSMKVDIFPALNLPVVYVAQPYGGMDAAQMEGLLTNYYEYHFLYINGIESVEAKSIQGTALLRLNFHSGTDMSQALAQTISYVNRAHAFMPPGTVSPFVIRYDAGTLPVGYLVFSSPSYTLSPDTGSCAESRASCVCDLAGRFISAAVRRKSAHHHSQCESAKATCLWALAGECGAGTDCRQQHSARRQREYRHH